MTKLQFLEIIKNHPFFLKKNVIFSIILLKVYPVQNYKLLGRKKARIIFPINLVEKQIFKDCAKQLIKKLIKIKKKIK